MSADLNTDVVLTALPASCRHRLQVMGWPDGLGPDLDRALRRAIGAPQQVPLLDLELDPERWHGQYVESWGTLGWSRETTCLGRIWLEPVMLGHPPHKPSYPPVFQARVTGIVLADAQVRAAHRTRHHSQGGYGRFGLFIAELRLASIRVEHTTGKRPAALGHNYPIFT